MLGHTFLRDLKNFSSIPKNKLQETEEVTLPLTTHRVALTPVPFNTKHTSSNQYQYLICGKSNGIQRTCHSDSYPKLI